MFRKYAQAFCVCLFIRTSYHMYRSLSTANILLHKCAPMKMRLPTFQARCLLMTSLAITRSQHYVVHFFAKLTTVPPSLGKIPVDAHTVLVAVAKLAVFKAEAYVTLRTMGYT